METHNSSDTFTREIESALRREALLAEGRRDAFNFGLECHGDIAQVTAKIRETEDQINHPIEPLIAAMAPGSSLRMYKDGYLTGLREVLKIIAG